MLDDEARLTWSEFADRVARAAGVLRGHGLRRGDRYALIMRNSFRQAELTWGGYWSGIVPVPVNWRLSPVEIAAILKDAGCALVAAEEEFLPLLDTPALGEWKKTLLQVESAGSRRADYESLLAATAPVPAESVAENDDAILIYTGGTTGVSKGVRLSHRNILTNAWQIGLTTGIRASDTYAHVVPMFHSADLHGTIGYLLGARHVYVPHFSPDAVGAAIERHRVSAVQLVPTMIRMVADSPGFDRYDVSSLRLLVYGSSPMPVEWARAARVRFPGVEIHGCYGLTETAPILTVLDHEAHLRCFESGDASLLKSAGKPVPGVQMRVVDDDDNPLPTGKPGEVVVRGANVTAGYHNRDSENAQAFRGGWFHTGDVGRFDDEGYLYLVDRKKDMIVTGGENVYSSEVEAVLYRHPGVAEAAVIGVPDERLGEALFAVIACKPGTAPTTADIIAHCREHIGGYKIPRQMAFVDALPRSAIGKVQKSALRKTYGAQAHGAAGEPEHGTAHDGAHAQENPAGTH